MQVSKIAIIHPTLNSNGGAENLILWTIKEFEKRDIDYKIFTRTLREDKSLRIKQEYSNISINPLIFRNEARILLDKIVEYNAVIIHNFPATVIWGYIYKEAKKRNIRLPKSFWYCHEPSIRLYGNDEKTYNKALKTIDPVARYTIKLDKYGVSKIDKVFANSKRTASHIKRVYNRDSVVIYPGIPKLNVQNKIDDSNIIKKYFMYVGRIEKPKNIEVSIEAFDIFLKKTKSYDTKFLIAGVGSDKKRLEDIVTKLAIEKNILFLGYISNEEKIKLLSESYAMILPAICEPFGLTVIEAFTSNTVTILSKYSGASEIVGSASEIVDVSSSKELSNSMIKLFSNESYRNDMLKKSREIIDNGVLFIDNYVNILLSELEK